LVYTRRHWTAALSLTSAARLSLTGHG
jgi:hypothetical protein